MPAFTLYGCQGSSNTDRVLLTLAEGGFTDYDLKLVDLTKGEQKSPENMKRHPWGKIPVIVFRDGFTLYESRAICKYLTRRFSFPLLPPESDLKASALFDQAQSVEMINFAEPAARISFENFGKRFLGLPLDETATANAVRALEVFFDVAERILSERDYMAGDSYSLADLYYVVLLQRVVLAGYADIIKRRRAVNAWWERCLARPAVQDAFEAVKKIAPPINEHKKAKSDGGN